MRSRHILVKTISSFIVTIALSSPIFAIDLNYDPELDAPTETQPHIPQYEARKYLPGERDSNNTISTQPLRLNNNIPFLNDSAKSQYTEPEDGWTVKALSISSDKEPYSNDERQSVKMAEEQMWQENGKNYDNNPLNPDNYRVNLEAEYIF